MPYTRPMRATFPAGHFLLASLPLLGLLALLAWLFGSEADALAVFRLHKDVHPYVKGLMQAVSDWGNPAFYLAYLGLLAGGLRAGDKRRTRFVAAYILSQLLICLAVVTLTKMALGRPRPEAATLLFRPLTLDPYFHSLPSGHTAEITGSCVALALWLRRAPLSLALGLAIALVGFSRLYLFQHYPTDVFFGWMFGSVSGFAAYAFGTTKDGPPPHDHLR